MQWGTKKKEQLSNKSKTKRCANIANKCFFEHQNLHYNVKIFNQFCSALNSIQMKSCPLWRFFPFSCCRWKNPFYFLLCVHKWSFSLKTINEKREEIYRIIIIKIIKNKWWNPNSKNLLIVCFTPFHSLMWMWSKKMQQKEFLHFWTLFFGISFVVISFVFFLLFSTLHFTAACLYVWHYESTWKKEKIIKE